MLKKKQTFALLVFFVSLRVHSIKVSTHLMTLDSGGFKPNCTLFCTKLYLTSLIRIDIQFFIEISGYDICIYHNHILWTIVR